MKDVIEQFKAVRFLATVMSGTATQDQLRESVIAQAMEENAVPYEQLKPNDRKECDEAVEGLAQLQGVFDDIVKAKAALTRKFFNALVAQGFDEAQALAITAAQPVEVKAGS